MKQLEWILCSERLPEEHESMFKKFKNTDKWNEQMFESISKEVIVTIEKDRETVVSTAHTVDGKWSNDILRWEKGSKVVAWMPFPEPFKQMKCWQDDDVVCTAACELWETCPEIDRITGRRELTPEEEEKIFERKN